jgi:four helix bundle protein
MSANTDLRLRTKQFSLRIIRMFTALPKTDLARVLGKQALRSGTSVGANYREAFRARSGPEFVSKIGDCLKELEETAYWLELLVESGVVPSTRAAGLQQETNELLAIFTTIAKKPKSRMSEPS